MQHREIVRQKLVELEHSFAGARKEQEARAERERETAVLLVESRRY